MSPVPSPTGGTTTTSRPALTRRRRSGSSELRRAAVPADQQHRSRVVLRDRRDPSARGPATTHRRDRDDGQAHAAAHRPHSQHGTATGGQRDGARAPSGASRAGDGVEPRRLSGQWRRRAATSAILGVRHDRPVPGVERSTRTSLHACARSSAARRSGTGRGWGARPAPARRCAAGRAAAGAGARWRGRAPARAPRRGAARAPVPARQALAGREAPARAPRWPSRHTSTGQPPAGRTARCTRSAAAGAAAPAARPRGCRASQRGVVQGRPADRGERRDAAVQPRVGRLRGDRVPQLHRAPVVADQVHRRPRRAAPRRAPRPGRRRAARVRYAARRAGASGRARRPRTSYVTTCQASSGSRATSASQVSCWSG